MRWTTQANRDLRAALSYYGEQSWDSAQEFLDQLSVVYERIETMPASGHPYLDGSRRILVPGFPFSVVYRLGGGEAAILAIAHGSRRPGYWLERE
jgi:plasmid stabilization system protein ParE